MVSMCAYVCLGGAGLMVGVWVGRVLGGWVWWLVGAEWGGVWQSVTHSAPVLSQLVAVAFELSIQIGWRFVSIAVVKANTHAGSETRTAFFSPSPTKEADSTCRL